MSEPVWVRRDVVVALQDWLIAEFGGAAGIRDEGLLESALSRPRHRFAYYGASPFELAAAYAFGLIRNHPFVDGNKRIALLTALTFLDLNGHRFVASPADATARTMALAAGTLDEAAFAAWLAAATEPTP